MEINEIIYMQLRIVRLFSQRFHMGIHEVNDMFSKHKIYDHINDCYGIYHCGGDEIVFNDVKMILRKEGAIT